MNIKIAVGGALALFANAAFSAPEFIPVQELAQGQSLVGSAQFNESVYSNPAAAAFTQIYSVEGAMMQGLLAASVVDTKTSNIGGTLGYFRRDETETSELLQSARLGFSRKISGNFAVGATGKTLWNQNRRMNDADVGFLARLNPVEIGFVTRNVLGGNLALESQQREFALGARFGVQNSLYFSASAASYAARPTAPYQYGIGAEFVSPYFFSIKGGYRLVTDTQESHWSAGISLLSPRLLAHYAVEFAHTNDGVSTHQIALSLLL